MQYLHANYVATLRKYSIVASVSRPASRGDNANCESFFRTLKRERLEQQNMRMLRIYGLKFLGLSTATTIEKGSILPSDIARLQNLRMRRYPLAWLEFQAS